VHRIKSILILEDKPLTNEKIEVAYWLLKQPHRMPGGLQLAQAIATDLD